LITASTTGPRDRRREGERSRAKRQALRVNAAAAAVAAAAADDDDDSVWGGRGGREAEES